jgi:cytochrome c peroxidase
MQRALKRDSLKQYVSLTLSLGLACGAVMGLASAVLAQEPGEPVELALPAPMGSLKTVPVTQELLYILRNPGDLPFDRRESSVPLPPLAVHQLNVNPLTGLELTLDNRSGPDQEINHEILFSPGDLLGTPGGLPAADGPSGPLLGNALSIFINEEDFIQNRAAATVLGKALFWDMQVGSDGVQACGSCHAKAGVDDRTVGQFNPDVMHVLDGNDATFELGGIDKEVTPADFPFRKLFDPSVAGEPLLNPGNVFFETNDVLSSMGVSRFKRFDDIPTPGAGAFLDPPVIGVKALAPDLGTVMPDPVAVNNGFRRVEPRHTPTFFAATLNFDNFWDGRARHDFNGGSVFGAADPQYHVFVNDGAATDSLRPASNGEIADLRPTTNDDNPAIDEDARDHPLRIRLSSMASLATGPVLSNFEMSFDGRNWPKVGKKLLQAGVTPLANQLVDVNDSVLGLYSNQGGSECVSQSLPTAVGKPGLCISYERLIEFAFYPNYWVNTNQYLVGTPLVCTTLPVNGEGEDPPGCDPFDGYVLGDPVTGAVDAVNTNQFRQIEANMSLFFGLGIQAWTHTQIPDDTPFDRFMDANPSEFLGVGFVPDGDPGTLGVQPLPLVGGLSTRQLQGFDLFTGSNHSGLNEQAKSARCGQCHNGPEMTDHSNNADHAFALADPISGQPKVISGYFLEDESSETAQDAVEIDNISFDLVTGIPTGHTLLDNGIYNIGVTRIQDDVLRGGNDPFGFPLSLAALALQNAGCPVGTTSCDPAITVDFLTALDAGGNPLPAGVVLGFEDTLPDYYLEWANEFTVGEAWPMIDRTVFLPDSTLDVNGVGIPTLTALPTGTFPNANRVGRMGNAKAPSLRNVELTGPYFHNGGELTLRQVIDFYGRGGNFPVTNAEHRDPHIIRLNDNTSAGGALTEAEKAALVDFLLALTDDRVRDELAPFDHPEIFLPLTQTAPENSLGRTGFVDDARFRQVVAVGGGGRPAAALPPLGNFLGVSSVEGSPGPDHFDSVTATPVGTAPIAVNDNATTKRNRKVTMGVLSNDSDPDGKLNRNSLSIVSEPANGTAVVSKGKVVYFPAKDFVGFDEFRYAFLDNLGNPSNVATVRLLVK